MQLWTVDVRVPYGAQGGEEGCRGRSRSSADRLSAPCLSPAGCIPARTRSRALGGWVWWRGRGPRSSRVLSGSPRAEGEGRPTGDGGRGPWVWRRGCPTHPTHTAGQLGASSKAGRTGSLNFPSVCGGRGARGAEPGAISHASPPRLHSPAPTPAPAPGGVGRGRRGRGHFLHVGGGEEARKRGTKGVGEEELVFK
jgi:hypothetical protein